MNKAMLLVGIAFVMLSLTGTGLAKSTEPRYGYEVLESFYCAPMVPEVLQHQVLESFYCDVPGAPETDHQAPGPQHHEVLQSFYCDDQQATRGWAKLALLTGE